MYQPSYPLASSSSAYYGQPGTEQMDEPAPSVLKTKRKRQSVDLTLMDAKQMRVRSPPPQNGGARDEGHCTSGSDEDMEPEGNRSDQMMQLDQEHEPWRPREEAVRDVSARQQSPWSAQPFTTSLHPPAPRVGLLQPTMYSPQPSANVSDPMAQVEAARRVHGPQCTTIPKLRLSEYPDPVTGQLTMWSHCADCGGCEKV